jgi:serine protease Do
MKLARLAPLMLPALGLQAALPAGVGASSLRRSAVVEAVERISPAVANIATESLRSSAERPFGLMEPYEEEYFQDLYEPPYRERPHTISLGSAVIVDPRGYLLTNEHVVLRAERVRVILADQQSFDARLIGTDPDSDLALLKIDAPFQLPVAKLGQSADLMIGETVIAIGNPFGLSHTVTTGVVSARFRSVKAGNKRYSDFIQTDASINPGNSGGPLLNIDGELIGINTAIYGEARGIGFAIPIDRARRVMEDLLRYGSVFPAWIGVEVRAVDDVLAQQLELAAAVGVVVTRVNRHGPAARAGIKRGDIILTLEGRTLYGPEDLDTYLSHHSAGDLLTLNLIRDRRRIRREVRALESDSPEVEKIAESLIGMKLAERSGRLVVTELVPGGRAEANRLMAGDIVVELNGQKLHGMDDWRKHFRSALGAGSVLLLVRRDEVAAYVPIRIR